jgi:hypothetical protein
MCKGKEGKQLEAHTSCLPSAVDLLFAIARMSVAASLEFVDHFHHVHE